jgi:hypothetical protein
MHMTKQKRVATVVCVGLGLTLGALVVLAQPPVEIDWDAIVGGGGSSIGGAVMVDDTLGQPFVGFAESGPVITTTGLWSAMTDRPRRTCGLAASKAAGHLRLDWAQVTEDINGQPISGLTYKVYRAINDPYFGPGTPYAGGISGSSYTDPDTTVLGNPARNAFYVVTAVDSFGVEGESSNHVGTFSLGLVPSSN